MAKACFAITDDWIVRSGELPPADVESALWEFRDKWADLLVVHVETDKGTLFIPKGSVLAFWMEK
jgi:hypothetical protein